MNSYSFKMYFLKENLHIHDGWGYERSCYLNAMTSMNSVSTCNIKQLA